MVFLQSNVWILLFGLSFLLLSISATEDVTKLNNATEAVQERTGKIFSLFSVVQFKNSGCKSQSSMTTGQSAVRNGTCYTASECSTKGGTASGNCAAGFGVCCLFLITATGTTISQNCTYLRNPSFPSVYSTTSSLSYTVSKCSSDVCYLRLDFETFTTLGPTTSSEVTGGVCLDTFKVTTNTGQLIPTICGSNTGQHIYVDIGNVATDTATLAFTFSTSTSTTRTWEIKVSQITCSNPARPPNGCLQYWTTLTGRITTFNWLSTATSHTQSLLYTACIRRAAGYCCVEYQQCAGITSSFTLDALAANAAAGFTDSYCTQDYIIIPGSSTTCTLTSTQLYNKYCGSYLGGPVVIAGYAPVCDCSSPFQVTVVTDKLSDTGLAAGPPATSSRGVCLDFMQVPCGTS